MLELLNISKNYGKEQILDKLNLSVSPGSRTAIVGPSGSGKTTLLRIIAGFETPESGQIILQGNTLFGEGQMVPAHQRRIGYVPQEGALFPHLSVGDNIAFGLNGSRSENRKRVAALMEMVSLDRRLAAHWPHEISGGQQQRVALARALAQQPVLMLLDEPFSALDTALRASTRKATATLLEQAGVASILVTHDQNEALSFASQIAVMRHGRFTQVGSPMEVYSRPANEDTAMFLGDALVLPASLRQGVAHCILGALPTNTTTTVGEKRIMLRPEQIQLFPHDEPVENGAAFKITDVDFAGFISVLTLSSTDWPGPIALKVVSQENWQSGMAVTVKVKGNVQVLND